LLVEPRLDNGPRFVRSESCDLAAVMKTDELHCRSAAIDAVDNLVAIVTWMLI